MASKNLTAGKKRGFGLYLDAAGIVLAVAVAGAVATVLCSTKSADYALAGLPLYLVLIVAAIALTVAGVLAQAKDGLNPIVANACSAVAVFALVFTGVKVIGARIILASGLFSWNGPTRSAGASSTPRSSRPCCSWSPRSCSWSPRSCPPSRTPSRPISSTDNGCDAASGMTACGTC